MKQLSMLAVAGVAAMATPLAAETRLATHEFNGSAGTAPSGWTGNTGFQLGRGYMETTGKQNGSGVLNVELRTWNSNSTRRTLFYEQGMRTTATYKPSLANREYIAIRARIKIDHTQKGIVHGFFLYQASNEGNSNKRQDEIDFEWLTNSTASGTSTAKDNINISSWRQWNIACGYNGASYSSTCGQQQSTTVGSGVSTEGWHQYEIKWFANNLIEYYVDGTKVGSMSGDKVPRDNAMPIFLNTWAPNDDWPDAYNSSLSLASSSSTSKTYRMQVDWMTIDKGNY